MGMLDIAVVAGLFLFLLVAAFKAGSYSRGVSGFLAANRCAGRYLLTLADGIAAVSALAFIGTFQQYYEAGFPADWWGCMTAPVSLALTLTGFIIYRFRETRAMTIAQFYEMRYSRRFRIFAGFLAWFAGVINYGIFPSVMATFLIHFCGIPEYIGHVGPLEVNVTLGAVMFVLLGVAVTITLRGGQLAIMVTDFFQAQYVNVVFLVIMVVLLYKFGLTDIFATLEKAPEGKSLLNPFKQGKIPDFNAWFFVIGAFNAVYTYMAWQGNQGFNCAAKSPHEAKMAKVLGQWRMGVTWTVIALIPICAYVLLNGNLFPEEAARARAAIEAVSDPGLQRQLMVPLALREMLPAGVLGLFVAAMLAAAISTDESYLHSWGSIFVQDVVLPLRNQTIEPEQHLRWLRRSILGVAVFVWCFGMLFPLQEYIFMYWAITGAIYTGGAGSVIIGGFYWKRATTEGAWAGMIVGSTLAVIGTIINNLFWPNMLPALKATYPDIAWLQALPKEFWLNGMEMFVLACCCAIASYVITSLLTKPDPNFDLDKLLRRGKYAIEGERRAVNTRKNWLYTLLGIDEEYTRFDKFLAYSLFVWMMFWFVTFIGGTLYGLNFETSDAAWAKWWVFRLGVWLSVGTITVVWFLWCGFRDLKEMIRHLRTLKEDEKDDGSVQRDETTGQYGEDGR